MTELTKIEALNEAYRVLDRQLDVVCHDANAIFAKVKHARDYIDGQIKEILGAEKAL